MERRSNVYLYYVVDDNLVGSELLARYHELLDPEERVRHAAFVFDHHRHQYLVAHALLRTSLSRHAPVEPAAWRFHRAATGKPELANPTNLRFNLSHTDGMSCCAISIGIDVGCDAEDTTRPVDLGIARTVCSPAELATMVALSAEERRERFYVYWTLKEAYVKARGSGLSLPLDQLTMHVDAGPIRIAFSAALDDDAATWSFAQLRPTARHLIACAVRAADAPAPEVRHVVPLVD